MGAATAAVAGLATTVIGGVMSGVGAAKEASAAAGQAKYQQAVLRNNQILAERQAVDALERGKIAEARSRRSNRQLIGRQRAVLAGNGVVVDEGSALDITSDTARIGEEDALTIRSNAEREALGYRTQGMNYEAESRLAGLRRESAQDDFLWGLGGSAINTASSVASKWYGFQREDVFGSSGSGSNFSYGMT